MRTEVLLKLLKARYGANAYAFFTNVADGTGGNASRWADGLAVSLWPSRGLTIEGTGFVSWRIQRRPRLSVSIATTGGSLFPICQSSKTASCRTPGV